MKTRNLSPIVLLLWLLAIPAWAQSWTFGPRLELQLSSSGQLDEVRIGDYRLSSNNISGSREFLGGFARYDQERWYAQAEYLRSSFSANSFRQGPGVGGSGHYLDARRQDIRVGAGVKPLPWLRLGGGLTYARYNWEQSEDERGYESVRQQLLTEQNPIFIGRLQEQLPYYDTGRQIDAAYRRSNVEGRLGVGVDIGGLTLDLTYNRSLTPIIDGITVDGASYAARHDYSYTTLSFGYRLFPLKAHLLSPRKRNPAYERIKRDIPFYRNELHVAAGLLGEGIGSAFIYENRYTRYLTRRFGLTVGANMMRVHQDFSSSSLPRLYSSFMLTTGIRLLPLYSPRHTIGLTTGPTITHRVGVGLSSGYLDPRNVNGQLVNVTDLRNGSRYRGWDLGWQSQVDYQFAATDRLLIGPWLRVLGQDFIVPDYASAGLQIGYRF